MAIMISLSRSGVYLVSRGYGPSICQTVRTIFNSRCYVFKKIEFAPCSLHTSQRNKTYMPQRDKDFKEIYRFKHINFTRLISRLKIYQTMFTIVASPGIIYLNYVGIISKMNCNFFIGLTTFACVMLYVMSEFFRRIACVIYYNEKEQKVDISHMTFWAKRSDVRLDLSELKPLSDTAEKKDRTFVRLETYNQGEAFYLFVKHGLTSDPDLLKKVLGL